MGMTSLKSTIFAAFCFAAHAPSQVFAAVTIEGDGPGQRISVSIQDAGLGAALHELGRIYGFEIKGALAEGDEAVSATLSGSLDAVLARLLRNANHVIVRSPGHRGGIGKVIILGGGSAPEPEAAQSGGGGARPPDEPPPYAGDGDQD